MSNEWGRANDAPDGFHFEVVEDNGLEWRAISPWESRPCRMLSGSPSERCGRPSVAKLNRRQRRAGTWRDSWWHYCDEHLYGRWVEDGRVMTWALRADARTTQPKEQP